LGWRSFLPWVKTPLPELPEPEYVLKFPKVRRVVFPLFEVEPLMPMIPLSQIKMRSFDLNPCDEILLNDPEPCVLRSEPKITAYIAH